MVYHCWHFCLSENPTSNIYYRVYSGKCKCRIRSPGGKNWQGQRVGEKKTDMKVKQWEKCAFKAERILCVALHRKVLSSCNFTLVTFHMVLEADHTQTCKHWTEAVIPSYYESHECQHHDMCTWSVEHFRLKHTCCRTHTHAACTHTSCYTTQSSSDTKGHLRSDWKPCCHCW